MDLLNNEKENTMMRKNILLVVLLFNVSWASLPKILSYQGQIQYNYGSGFEPIRVGLQNFKFSLWDSPELGLGTLLWQESQSIRVGTPGLINVTLGSMHPIEFNKTDAGVSYAWDFSIYIQIEYDPDQDGSYQLITAGDRILLTAALYSLQSVDLNQHFDFDNPTEIFIHKDVKVGTDETYSKLTYWNLQLGTGTSPVNNTSIQFDGGQEGIIQYNRSTNKMIIIADNIELSSNVEVTTPIGFKVGNDALYSKLSDWNLQLGTGTSPVNNTSIQFDGGQEGMIQYNRSTNKMMIQAENIEFVSTTTSANGDFNINGNLAVNGDITVASWNIMTTPDYVFRDDYKLMPLYKVEEYTKENSHLPEVPSAKEISKNGVKIGEMNQLLLKKVEELTLYIIEQEKAIKKQNAAINIMEKEMQKIKSKMN